MLNVPEKKKEKTRGDNKLNSEQSEPVSNSALESSEADIEAEVMDITPEMAAEFMECNKYNRKPSPDVVKKYSADMKAKRWRFTGDPIQFDNEGVLINGQHRLMACMDAGVPFRTVVMRGLPNDTKEVIDLGRKRNTAAILNSLGYSCTPLVTAAAQALITIKHGGVSQRNRVSTPMIIDLLEKHPELAASAEFVAGQRNATKVTLSALNGGLVAVHYIASHFLGKKADADAFVSVFKLGVPVYNGDAAHALREVIISNRMKNLTMRDSYRLGSLCQAWNQFEKRVPVDRFRKQKDAIIDGFDVDNI